MPWALTKCLRRFFPRKMRHHGGRWDERCAGTVSSGCWHGARRHAYRDRKRRHCAYRRKSGHGQSRYSPEPANHAHYLRKNCFGRLSIISSAFRWQPECFRAFLSIRCLPVLPWHFPRSVWSATHGAYRKGAYNLILAAPPHFCPFAPPSSFGLRFANANENPETKEKKYNHIKPGRGE